MDVRPRRYVAAFATGLAAGYLALGLIPAASGVLGPANVTVRAKAVGGSTELQLPPLGSVSASTHAPLANVTVAVSAVDFETLGPLATSALGRVELREDVEQDLRSLVQRVALQLLLGTLVVGGVVAAIIWKRRLREVIAGAAGGLVAGIVTVGAVATTFQVGAFEEPRFEGTLLRARAVIETVNRQVEVLDDARSRYEIATRRLSDLLVLLAEPESDPRAGTVAILHVSDIHANPIGLEIVQQLAAEFGVDMVVDSGDLAASTLDTGEISSLTGPVDAALVRALQDVQAPYLFVPGNHDSFLLRNRIDSARGVRILDQEPVTVSGVNLMGWADPTFSTIPTSPEDKAAERSAQAPIVADAVAEVSPDVLAVHDPLLASDSIGLVPLILAGHTHSRNLEEVDGTIIATVGSTGATGLKTFTAETSEAYEAEVLYLQETKLIAIDYITLRGLGSDFVIDRKTFPQG